MVVDQVGSVGQNGADGARLICGPELFWHISGGTSNAADKGDIRQLADSARHLFQVGKGLRCAQVMRRLNEEVLRNRLIDREMAVQRGIPDGAWSRRPQRLAVVVVVAHEAGTAGQDGQHEQTGSQMYHWAAHNADAGTPPEPSGQFAPWFDPTARPGKHQNCRQQSKRSQECHADPNRRRHSDRFEHSHSSEADEEESDSHRGGGCGDHFPDGDHCLLDRLVEIRTRPQIVVIAADEKDRVIRSRAGHDRTQKYDGLVRDARVGQLRVARHHRLCDHQGQPDRYQRQQHGDRTAVDQ